MTHCSLAVAQFLAQHREQQVRCAMTGSDLGGSFQKSPTRREHPVAIRALSQADQSVRDPVRILIAAESGEPELGDRRGHDTAVGGEGVAMGEAAQAVVLQQAVGGRVHAMGGAGR